MPRTKRASHFTDTGKPFRCQTALANGPCGAIRFFGRSRQPKFIGLAYGALGRAGFPSVTGTPAALKKRGISKPKLHRVETHPGRAALEAALVENPPLAKSAKRYRMSEATPRRVRQSRDAGRPSCSRHSCRIRGR
jgi:hypothetical protein